MRTAEEILNKHYNIDEGFTEHEKECFVNAINEARKETIEECAERAEAWIYNEGDEPKYGVDKPSILKLINELK